MKSILMGLNVSLAALMVSTMKTSYVNNAQLSASLALKTKHAKHAIPHLRAPLSTLAREDALHSAPTRLTVTLHSNASPATKIARTVTSRPPTVHLASRTPISHTLTRINARPGVTMGGFLKISYAPLARSLVLRV
jgi:hypothetical protein